MVNSFSPFYYGTFVLEEAKIRTIHIDGAVIEVGTGSDHAADQFTNVEVCV
jgi:hypothetical protein